MTRNRARIGIYSLEGLALAGIYLLSWWVVSTSLFRTNSEGIGLAVLIDLTLTAGLLHYCLGIRLGGMPGWTILPVVGTGYTIATLLGPDLPFQQSGMLLVVAALVELGVAGAVLFRLAQLIRGFREARRRIPDRWPAFERSLAGVLGYPRLAQAVRIEVELLWLALFGWFRRPQVDWPGDPDLDSFPFTIHKRPAWIPLVGALVFLSLAEFGVIHYLLIQAGWMGLATLSLIVHLYALLWLIGDSQALRLRPVLVSSEGVLIRVGLRWSGFLPATKIREGRQITGPAGEGLSLVLLGSPNVVLELEEPLELQGLFGIRRSSDRLFLQLDEPEAFLESIGGFNGREV